MNNYKQANNQNMTKIKNKISVNDLNIQNSKQQGNISANTNMKNLNFSNIISNFSMSQHKVDKEQLSKVKIRNSQEFKNFEEIDET